MKPAIAILLTFVGSLCLWLFSVPLFGHQEPFDGNLGKLVLLMTVIPVLATIIAGKKYVTKFWAWPLIGLLGHILGAIIIVGPAPLMIIGIGFLCIYSLPALILCAIAMALIKLSNY